jgi:tetratricopeptide (TPR) repeat protein
MLHAMRSVRALLFALLLVVPAAAVGQDQGPFFDDDPGDKDDPQALGASTDESTPDYLKALELQRKGKWKTAKRAFEKVLEKYPKSVHADEIEDRSGDNAFLGCTVLWRSGPPQRRIDVSVMGDGFTIEPKSQKKQKEWADHCLTVLFSEAAFEEYKHYFNYYFVRLASYEEGVDQKDPDAALRNAENEERRKKRKKRRKRRKKKKRKFDFNTALDCKAAGPQGQVMADRTLVYSWLDVAAREEPGCRDDRLVIAFAQFGKLGMGGGGIANVGRPDKSVTVHEFGHAFVGLLDEYANQPGPPQRVIRAANATSDPKDVPWQHFLDLKVKGVEVLEGGATFKKGVWRPAPSCAMNSAGATGFCPVCREAAVLRIYSYIDPIDAFSPATTYEMFILEGDDETITITPMQPLSHDLEVNWFVETLSEDAAGPPPPDEKKGGFTMEGGGFPSAGFFTSGLRGRQEREGYEKPPVGDLSKLGMALKKKKGEPRRHQFLLGKLPAGRYRITAQVIDTTKMKKERHPWVLRDPKRLLEERKSWWVTVDPEN